MPMLDSNTNIQPNINNKSFFQRKEKGEILQAIQRRDKCINILPNDVEIVEDKRGGLGKTVLIKQVMQTHYKKCKNAKKLKLIDLSKDINTPAYLIQDIVQNLSYLGYKDSFKETQKYISEKIVKDQEIVKDEETVKNEEPVSYKIRRDPSKLIYESFARELEKSFEKDIESFNPKKPIYLFFDSYDKQYTGENLQEWLSNQLFPLLIKYDIYVVITGRRKTNNIIVKKKTDNEPEISIEPTCIGLSLIQKTEIMDFIQSFLSEKKAENLITDAEKHKDKIYEYTNGRPILLTILGEFLYNFAQEEPPLSFIDLESAVNEYSREDKEEHKFIDYAVNHLSLNVHERRHATERGLELMSICRHRLTPHLFQCFKEDKIFEKENTIEKKLIEISTKERELKIQAGSGLKLIELRKKRIEMLYKKDNAEKIKSIKEEIETLEDTTYQIGELIREHEKLTKFEKELKEIEELMKDWEKNLSFVKGIEDNELSLRLHDEFYDWMEEYYWKKIDENNKLRNGDIQFLIEYYDTIFLKNRDIYKNITTDTYIIEKLDALLRVKGEKEEIAAIQVFLYEFVRSIDEQEALAERLLQKAMMYFEKYNEDESLSIEFRSALIEIPLRKIEYLLTTKFSGGRNEIENTIGTIFAFMDIPLILQNIIGENKEFINTNKAFIGTKNALSIEKRQVVAKVWVYLAELHCYTNEFDGALEYAKISMEFLYEEDKKVWLLLAASLRGFVHQSMGNFQRAERWHIRAKEIALDLLDALIREKETLQNTKETGNINRNKYRIHFALKTLSRAIGNQSLKIRYVGQLMESANNLANLINFNVIAESTSARELSRFVTGYLDRLPTLLMYEDMQKYEEYISDLKTDKIIEKRKNNILLKDKYIKAGKPNYLNILLAEDYYKKIFVFNANDETYQSEMKELRQKLGIADDMILVINSKDTAETHYVNGKHYLASLNDKGKPDFEHAEKQFIYARDIAKAANFKYLELDALEALLRLKYLQSHTDSSKRNEKLKYQREFEKLSKELAENNIFYHDILAKYYNTVGDIAFEDRNILAQSDSLIEAEQKRHLQAAFEAYCKMIEHALKHNEHRYNTTLGVLLNRFEKLKEHDNADSYIPFCWEIVEKSLASLERKDNFLSSFLDAAKLAVSFDGKENVGGEAIKAKIREFVTATHFSKALHINDVVIKFYKNYSQELKTASIILASFNQSFCYLATRQVEKARMVLVEAENSVESDKDLSKPKREALLGVIEIGRGILRTKENHYWDLEEFILGELYYFRKERNERTKNSSETTYSWDNIITTFHSGIRKIYNYYEEELLMEGKTQEARGKRKSYLRILSSAFMGLGQLYLLLEATNEKGDIAGKDEVIGEYKVEKDELLMQMKKIVEKEGYIITLANDCVSVSYLSAAAEIAAIADDEHREVDAFTNIVNAIYFAKQPLLDEVTWNENERMIGLREQVDTTTNRKKYPYLVSKYLLTRGDIIFGKLFSIDGLSYDAAIEKQDKIVVKRYEPNGAIKEWDKLKYSKLREMMYHYLDALNLLAGQTDYHTSEFSNLLKQIKHRIMLVHSSEYISLLKDGFSVIWQNFEHLANRNSIMREIESTMKMHDISLKIRSSTS